MTRKPGVIAAFIGALALTIAHVQSAHATEPATPGFNNKIPDKVMTPDKVETRLVTLNFVDGVPTLEIEISGGRITIK